MACDVSVLENKQKPGNWKHITNPSLSHGNYEQQQQQLNRGQNKQQSKSYWQYLMKEIAPEQHHNDSPGLTQEGFANLPLQTI